MAADSLPSANPYGPTPVYRRTTNAYDAGSRPEVPAPPHQSLSFQTNRNHAMPLPGYGNIGPRANRLHAASTTSPPAQSVPPADYIAPSIIPDAGDVAPSAQGTHNLGIRWSAFGRQQVRSTERAERAGTSSSMPQTARRAETTRAAAPFPGNIGPRPLATAHPTAARESHTSAHVIQPVVPVPLTDTMLNRPKIIFRPVVSGIDPRGSATLRPDVKLADATRPRQGLSAMRLAQVVEGQTMPLPPPADYRPQPEPVVEPGADPFYDDPYPMEAGEYAMPPDWMGPVMADECGPGVERVGPVRECWYRLMANLNGPRSAAPGVGTEHVMNALFWIDTTQPLNSCRIRADAAADWEFPDRAEYFWAKTPGGRGPQSNLPFGEPSVDYQDLRFYIERGGERFSVGTEIPIRAVDPEVRLNSAGLADMNLTTKAVFLDGRDWQLTQTFRTHFPTGSARRGTGNGHFSLEPGVAYRYKWSDVTYFHGDLSYWFPIAADPRHSGQFLNYGIAVSHVAYDSDSFAVIPTLELDAWTILDGRQTLPGPIADPNNPLFFDEIDTIGILNVHPGVRIVCDTCGDCGTKEFGISGGFAVTDDHWYEGILRLEFRWTY